MPHPIFTDRRELLRTGFIMPVAAAAAALPRRRAGRRSRRGPYARGARHVPVHRTRGRHQGRARPSQTFDHVRLPANDLDLVVDWYVRVFGFQETHRFELPDYVGVAATLAYLRLGNVQLEIFGNPTAEVGRPEPMSFPETIAFTKLQHFRVRVDDMEATIAALEDAGIPIFLGPDTNTILNRTFIHIKDPEGNDVEIVKWEA